MLEISELDYKAFQLMKNHPEELGFVIQCKDYDDYLTTYTDAGGSVEEAELNKEEFDFLKNYFLGA